MPSSVIATINYDPSGSVLRIIFLSGMEYEYRNVPESVYLEMKHARSKGKFLNEKIKGNYLFRKIGDHQASANSEKL